jgi:hypothetical protein
MNRYSPNTKRVWVVIEWDEPQGEDLHAITDLGLYLEEWNECMETDYTTMEDFNRHATRAKSSARSSKSFSPTHDPT